jgi:CBS domain-containing protein
LTVLYGTQPISSSLYCYVADITGGKSRGGDAVETALLVTPWIRTGSTPPGQSELDGPDLVRGGPALGALTDFRREAPITIPSDRTVDTALTHMQRAQVRALLVTRALRGSGEQQVIGLVTAQDVHRRRSGLHQQRPVLRHESDARVEDVMTPWDQLPLVNYKSLRGVTAGELCGMFQGTGLTHLVVVEMHANNCVYVRGLLSRAMLARRLGHSQDGASGSRRAAALDARQLVA